MSFQKEKEENAILDFNNGLFQGKLSKDYRFLDKGIFIWDDGSFFAGEWKQSIIQGRAIYISPGELVFYGNFARNVPEGLGIVRFMTGEILIGNWSKGKLSGSIFYYDYKNSKWTHFEFSNGKCVRRIAEELQKDGNEIHLLHSQLEYQELYSKGLLGYLRELEFGSRKLLESEDFLYFGFIKGGKAHGLGLTLNKKTNDFVCIGCFSDGRLNGFGREFKDSVINDGVFKAGEFQKIGVSYETFDGTGIVCTSKDNEPKKIKIKDVKEFNELAAKSRGKLHKKSLKYYDSFFKIDAVLRFSELKAISVLQETNPLVIDSKSSPKSPPQREERKKNESHQTESILQPPSSSLKKDKKIKISALKSRVRLQISKSIEIPPEKPSNGYFSVDSCPLRKKSKFFTNSLKHPKKRVASKKPKKEWDSRVKIVHSDKKPRKEEAAKTERLNRNFVYLNVLQKNFKTITPRKHNTARETDTTARETYTTARETYTNARETYSSSKNETLPSLPPKESGSIPEIPNSDRIQESSKQENPPKNKNDLNKLATKTENRSFNNYLSVSGQEIRDKGELKMDLSGCNSAEENQSNGFEETAFRAPDSPRTGLMSESVRKKKEVSKLMLQKLIERKTKEKSKAGTLIVGESLANIYWSKLTNKTRNDSRGFKPDSSKLLQSEEDEEDRKMMDFLKNRMKMANLCKINVMANDQKKKTGSLGERQRGHSDRNDDEEESNE